MIKASDIIYLLEKWVTIRGRYTIEILVNPHSWRDAASKFKNELREVAKETKKYKEGNNFNSLLRFSYYASNDEIKAWVAYWATHYDIDLDVRQGCWDGWGDLSHKEFNCVNSTNSERPYNYIDSLEDLPGPLQKFLSGLELNPDLET